MVKNTPKKWSEISFEKYLQTLELPEMPDNLTSEQQEVFNMGRSAELLSIVSGASIEQINNSKPNDVIEAFTALNFMQTEMPKVKVKHKAKTTKEITYQNFLDYINYSKSKDSHRYLPDIISLFFNDLKSEDVMKMPTDYVFSCFFLLLKKAKRYWKISLFKTARELMTHLIREAIGKLKLKLKSK